MRGKDDGLAGNPPEQETVGRIAAAMDWIDDRLRPSGKGRALPTDHRLRERDVVGRLKDLSLSYYAGIFNVIKGVALAAIGVSAAELYAEGRPASRWVLLVVAFLAVVITYNGAAVGRTITHLHPATVDAVLPMAMAIVEIIVIRLAAVIENGEVPLAWLVALSVWHLMASAMIYSIIFRIRWTYYDPGIWSVIEVYLERMLFDWRSATGGGLLTLAYVAISLLAWPNWPGWTYLDVGFAVLIGLLLCKGLRHQEETRQEMIKGLRDLAAPALPVERAQPTREAVLDLS